MDLLGLVCFSQNNICETSIFLCILVTIKYWKIFHILFTLNFLFAGHLDYVQFLLLRIK